MNIFTAVNMVSELIIPLNMLHWNYLTESCILKIIMKPHSAYFLDLWNAFDTLDHNILLNKLKHYGIIRGEALTFWKLHIERCALKCSRNIGMLNKLKRFLPTTIMLTLYHTLIHSHLSYGIIVWGHYCDRLIKIQKKALRVVNLSKYNAHCDPLFKKFKIARSS